MWVQGWALRFGVTCPGDVAPGPHNAALHPDHEPRTLNPKPETINPSPSTLNLRFRVSDFGFRVQGAGLLGFRVSFGFPVEETGV